MRPEPRLLPIRREPKLRSRKASCECLEARIVPSTSSAAPLINAAAPIEGLYPGDVLVTSNLIITPYERIPRFAADPTITSVRSGDWTDPSVWAEGRVPTDNDRVVISANTTVNYATANDTHVNCVEVDGSLVFSTTVDTRMVVGTLTVMPTGTLQIGTAAVPVAQGVEAELVIADQPLQLLNDPRQYGTGLIALGTVTMHGSAVNKTWNRLAAEPRAGDISLLISGDIAGWRVGDELLLPDSRQVPTSDGDAFKDGTLDYQDEEVVISRILGNRVVLASPLRFSHPGARNAAGALELLPHVALLERNVVVESENPQGTRGYTLFTARANVDIRYAAFEDLGRTANDRPIDNSIVSFSGQISHIGTNQSGRHAVYFDHLIGLENPDNTGFQYKFIGNSIEYSTKWAVAVNDTSFGMISGNVVYDADGAGFVTCAGTEIGNLFSVNMTVGVSGTYDEHATLDAANGDYARGGSGFWFRRGGNTVMGNVATDSTYGGFVIDSYYNTGSVLLPKFRGADVRESGQGTYSWLTPSAPFAGNEAYGMTSYGLWMAFVSGDNLLPNQPRTQIINTKIWNVLTAGVRAYHTANISFSKLLILGDLSAEDRNDTGTRGLDLRYYENRAMTIVDSRIEGVRTGIIAPNNDSTQPGAVQPTLVQNTILRNYINVLVMPALDDRPSSGASLVLRDVKFGTVGSLPLGPLSPGAVQPPANIQMKLSGFNGDYLNLTSTSTVLVYNYNQVPGDNFQVFYPEQAANYVMPQTNPDRLSGRLNGLIGSPEQGLTNGQNRIKYGIAIGGSLAPPDARASRPEIKGLVAPIQNIAAVTPRIGLATPWDGAFIDGQDPIRIRYNMSGVLPAGARIYFVLDNGTPFTTFRDGGLYDVAPGNHTLRVFIGDSNGVTLPGTGQQTVQFTVAPTFDSPTTTQAATDPSSANAITSALAIGAATTTASAAQPLDNLPAPSSAAPNSAAVVNATSIIGSAEEGHAGLAVEEDSLIDDGLLTALATDAAAANR